jgi:hypothetical protein
MSTLLIILIILLVLALAGGGWGYGRYGAVSLSPLGIIIILLTSGSPATSTYEATRARAVLYLKKRAAALRPGRTAAAWASV